MNVPAKKRKGETLTLKQNAAISALVESPTIVEAARIVGISRTSLWLWLKLEPFKARLMEARAEVFRENMAGLKASLSKATTRLSKLLDSKDENIQRLSASTIWSLCLKANESIDLEERLARLEKIAFGDKQT